MGADFPDDEEALTELRMLSDRAKGYLAHHIRNPLTVIMLGVERGKLALVLEAANHIAEDLARIVDWNAGQRKRSGDENQAQQNLMKIVEYLSLQVSQPVRPLEISNALGIGMDYALHTLVNLASRGWADQVGTNWRLSSRIVRIADPAGKKPDDVQEHHGKTAEERKLQGTSAHADKSTARRRT